MIIVWAKKKIPVIQMEATLRHRNIPLAHHIDLYMRFRFGLDDDGEIKVIRGVTYNIVETALFTMIPMFMQQYLRKDAVIKLNVGDVDTLLYILDRPYLAVRIEGKYAYINSSILEDTIQDLYNDDKLGFFQYREFYGGNKLIFIVDYDGSKERMSMTVKAASISYKQLHQNLMKIVSRDASIISMHYIGVDDTLTAMIAVTINSIY